MYYIKFLERVNLFSKIKFSFRKSGSAGFIARSGRVFRLVQAEKLFEGKRPRQGAQGSWLGLQLVLEFMVQKIYSVGAS